MDTLGFARLRENQSRGPERELRRWRHHPKSLYAYPTDAPFQLTLGDVPTLQDCPVPISLYRAAAVDVVDHPVIVERYFAGVMGHLYPIRLRTISYDQPTQTFANLPGMNALFASIAPPGLLQTVQVKDPVYAVQDQAFQVPILPPTGGRLCPDGLSTTVAYRRLEELLRIKAQSDAQRCCPRLRIDVGRLIADAVATLRPQVSLRDGRRWGDAQAKISGRSAMARMGGPPQSYVGHLLPTPQGNLLAYSPAAAAGVADTIDRLPLTDFSLTVHYEADTPLLRTWNHAGDRYWPWLVEGRIGDHQGNLRRTLIDEQMTALAFQVSSIVPTLLEDQALYLGGLSLECRHWIDQADFLRGPYVVVIDKTHFGEARLTYSPATASGEAIAAAGFSIHLDLPFMALACASLAVERI